MDTTQDSILATSAPSQVAEDNNKPHSPGRRQPLVAYRALKQLIANPEETDKVFVILRALSGDAIERGYRRFATTPVGQRVRAEQSSLLDPLCDRDSLRALPANSLGRAYLAFVEREQLTADGLVEASEQDQQFNDENLRQYAERLRDMHDLWHVTTDYGRDSFGEVCLLAFTYAQTRNLGVGVIALVGAFKTWRELGQGVWRAVFRGYRDGRRAAWMPAADWERLLTLPIEVVRRELNIAAPVPYQTVKLRLAG